MRALSRDAGSYEQRGLQLLRRRREASANSSGPVAAPTVGTYAQPSAVVVGGNASGNVSNAGNAVGRTRSAGAVTGSVAGGTGGIGYPRRQQANLTTQVVGATNLGPGVSNVAVSAAATGVSHAVAGVASAFQTSATSPGTACPATGGSSISRTRSQNRSSASGPTASQASGAGCAQLSSGNQFSAAKRSNSTGAGSSAATPNRATSNSRRSGSLGPGSRSAAGGPVQQRARTPANAPTPITSPPTATAASRPRSNQQQPQHLQPQRLVFGRSPGTTPTQAPGAVSQGTLVATNPDSGPNLSAVSPSPHQRGSGYPLNLGSAGPPANSSAAATGGSRFASWAMAVPATTVSPPPAISPAVAAPVAAAPLPVHSGPVVPRPMAAGECQSRPIPGVAGSWEVDTLRRGWAQLAPALQDALDFAMSSGQERMHMLVDPTTKSWIRDASTVDEVRRRSCSIYVAYPREQLMGKVGGEAPRLVRWVPNKAVADAQAKDVENSKGEAVPGCPAMAHVATSAAAFSPPSRLHSGLQFEWEEQQGTKTSTAEDPLLLPAQPPEGVLLEISVFERIQWGSAERLALHRYATANPRKPSRNEVCGDFATMCITGLATLEARRGS